VASAAGLMAFMRTLGTALATSVATSVWADGTQVARAELSGVLNGGPAFLDSLTGGGFTTQQGRAMIEQLVERQSAAISASHLFMVIGVLCILVAQLAWVIPKAKPRGAAPMGGH
jgi:DHA2 family multidrug resistance protein